MLKFASSTRHVVRYTCLTAGIGTSTVANVAASVTDCEADNTHNETAEPMPHSSADGPWHFTNIWMTLEEAPTDIESYCVTFRVEADVEGEVPIYISPINQRINKVPLYGGIQTNIDGFDEDDPVEDRIYRHRGAIFSRWGERDFGATRRAPGGLFESGGYEGDFVSVRNNFAWTRGRYRLCLVKADIVAGEPLPEAYDTDDIAYGWGRFAHTWVRMEATDLGSGEITFIGALAFPGESLTMRETNVVFYEAYGSRTIPVHDLRPFEVVVEGIRVDGEQVAYREVVEIVNPFDIHADAPAMARSKYRDSGEIATRAGAATGSRGKSKAVLHSQ